MRHTNFVPGLELCEQFYWQAVRPVLRRHGDFAHAAARIGGGSEVLGFDTPRSADHEWGPQLQLFLRESDIAHRSTLDAALAQELPKSFLGWPTHFAPTGDGAIRRMSHTDGPVQHRVEITTLGKWCVQHVGIDPLDGVRSSDWLAMPTQALAGVTRGRVFRDEVGLTGVRDRLSWYPTDIWRVVLAAQWRRIAQREAFPGRCAEVGDDIGVAVNSAAIVRDMLRLALLMDRRYPPYDKWLGSAVSGLSHNADLVSALSTATRADDWSERERGLVRAYEEIATRHNDLALTPPLDPSVRRFFQRPFLVIDGERFVAALLRGSPDAVSRQHPQLGGIDQLSDSVDVLTSAHCARAIIEALSSKFE